MNRTDRLYAIVEELRAVAPCPRSARWLAERFEVTTRTIERDVGALQQSGTPIWAEPGRTGGYCLDRDHTLPPVNLTPGEAVAMAVALERLGQSPFRADAAAALRKLVAAMRPADVAAARGVAGRVHLLDDAPDDGLEARGGPVPRLLSDALTAGRVLRIRYADREGAETTRDVEPLGYIGKTRDWYLIAWCRLREGVRAFRVDRVRSVTVTAETPPPRELSPADLDIRYGEVRGLPEL